MAKFTEISKVTAEFTLQLTELEAEALAFLSEYNHEGTLAALSENVSNRFKPKEGDLAPGIKSLLEASKLLSDKIDGIRAARDFFQYPTEIQRSALHYALGKMKAKQ